MLFNSNNKSFFFPALLAIVLSAGVLSCVKTDFDEPPTGGDPVILVPTTTIAELKAIHTGDGTFDKVTQDWIIGGEVVMDDKSGNYYKTLVIQDASGGIEVKFNDGYLYQQYPIGRTIYIRVKDLIVSDYNGMPQLIGSTVTENGVLNGVGITDAQARAKVVKGPFATTRVTPKVVTLASIKNKALLGTLVQLNDVQFTPCDAGKTYADAVTQYSLNRLLEDCNGGPELILRSSGFATFANERTPTGKGTIVGTLGVYNNDYQLYIRNTDDAANMTGPRCGAGGGASGTLADISAIRAIFTGTTTTAPANTKIKGVVISDRLSKNLNSRNVYIQDGSAGIVVRFTADHCFELGDEIEVTVSGLELSEFNKLLQVNNVPIDQATIVGTGKTVVPRTATVAEINANYNAWEGTLVKIVGATITGGTTLAGSHTVADASGSIALFTQAGATFAGSPAPTGPVTVTAIVSDFNGKQIILRNLSDIQ
ncbi:MAG: DUF5689 domain-containing protein [Saprospiraceae bacterium]